MTEEGGHLPNNNETINLTSEIDSELSVNPNTAVPETEDSKETIPEDFENSDTEFEAEKRSDDYIDEEELKSLEVNLTDEEKEFRHNESLELKKKGNDQFKSGNHLDSVYTYTEALKRCPLSYKNDRSILYANRAASKISLSRNKSAIEDCSRAIELNENYVRAYLRRAKLYEETDKLDESLEDYKKVLGLDKNNKDALQAQYRLPPLIEARNEKLKTEMLGKLKDLGNMFLKPFGLSTENFQLAQDSKTGGYSVNFQQNK